MVELRDVWVFVKAAELRSLSAAAAALRLPKSTASRSLARLEEGLGVALLRRDRRRLALTEPGALFHRHALRILGEVERAETVLSHARGVPRGLLRVTAPFTLGRAFLAPLLPEFLERHPEIRVSLELASRGVDLLGSEVDVAIRVGPLEDSRLRARKLGFAELWLCASPGYLKRHPAPTAPAELEQHEVLDASGTDGPRLWSLVGPSGAVNVRVMPRLEVNDASVLRVAALAGTGLAWIPDFLCHADLGAGRLLRVLPDWSRDTPEIHAVFPGGRALTPKVRAFVEFLGERLRIRALEDATARSDVLGDLVG